MTTEVRKRPGKGTSTNGDVKQSPKQETSKRSSSSSGISFGFLDLLRVVAGLALASTLGSYVVTKGESYIWNQPRPWWTNPAKVQRYFAKPVYLTVEQLAEYDGSTPGKPIYLAINRTIYDVSASPQVYGPGGFYSKLAAKDASRSFVTTCFDPKEDLVPWLGGTEEIFVPLWLSKADIQKELATIAGGDAEKEIAQGRGMRGMVDEMKRRIGRKKVLKLQEEAYEMAKDMVRDKIGNWESMFKNKDYPIVGRVVGLNETDETQWNKLGFCEAAKKQRPSMGLSLQEAMKANNMDGTMNIGRLMGLQKDKGKDKSSDQERKENKQRLVKENKKKKYAKKKGKDKDSPTMPAPLEGMEDILLGGDSKKGPDADSTAEPVNSGGEESAGDEEKKDYDMKDFASDDDWDKLKEGVGADDPIRSISIEELLGGSYVPRKKSKESEKPPEPEADDDVDDEELSKLIREQAADL